MNIDLPKLVIILEMVSFIFVTTDLYGKERFEKTEEKLLNPSKRSQEEFSFGLTSFVLVALILFLFFLICKYSLEVLNDGGLRQHFFYLFIGFIGLFFLMPIFGLFSKYVDKFFLILVKVAIWLLKTYTLKGSLLYFGALLFFASKVIQLIILYL